jgi:hypothetical protein
VDQRSFKLNPPLHASFNHELKNHIILCVTAQSSM